MKKILLYLLCVPMAIGCVSQTKYDSAIKKIAELELQIDELKNGEDRLSNLFSSYISKNDYLKAGETFDTLVAKHPESPYIIKLKEENSIAFIKIQTAKDSVAKAVRDSIRLANIDDIGDWQIGDFVNDFKEPTGEHYIYKRCYGTFSNTATANSELAVNVQVYKYCGYLSIDIKCDEYANGTNDEVYYGRHWKVVCPETRKIYTGYYGDLNEKDENGNGTGNSISIQTLFEQESTFEFTSWHEYSTVYHYTINTKGFQNALLKAGIVSLDDI